MCDPDPLAGPMVDHLKVQQSHPWHLDGGPMLRRIGAALGGTVGVIFMIQWEYSNQLGYIYIYNPYTYGFQSSWKNDWDNMFFYLRGFIMGINWNITGLGVQLGLFMGIYIYIHDSWNICSYSHGNNICNNSNHQLSWEKSPRYLWWNISTDSWNFTSRGCESSKWWDGRLSFFGHFFGWTWYPLVYNGIYSDLMGFIMI